MPELHCVFPSCSKARRTASNSAIDPSPKTKNSSENPVESLQIPEIGLKTPHFKLQVRSFQTQFRNRWRSRKFRNNGHACTSIVVQINTDDEKDGFELFTGTMMYFRVLLYVREFTEQHHFRTSGPGRSLPVDSGCCSADLRAIEI